MTMAREEGSTSKRGNGIVGVLREVHNKWERRAPVTPAHCARLLNAEHGVKRILVQPCTKRIFPDAQYEEVGCEITPDLSDCGLLLGIKRPEELLPERSYAFFSHTHKLQPENMSVLDQVLEKRISLYDYELILGEHGERLVAFGQYAGLAGMIDLLRGLGERFLSQGFSTPFLSLGSSYMYTSLKEAKQAVLAVGEEIKNAGLPLGICPLIFVFTGTGNGKRYMQNTGKHAP
jgi:alpha-aminoadipic semialdehyde synthase